MTASDLAQEFDDVHRASASATFDDYQRYTKRHAQYPADIGLFYTALGLAGEAGEVANKIKKVYRDDDTILTDERRLQIFREMGGALWYLSAMATELGVRLSDIARLNLEELDSRLARGTVKGDGDTR